MSRIVLIKTEALQLSVSPLQAAPHLDGRVDLVQPARLSPAGEWLVGMPLEVQDEAEAKAEEEKQTPVDG
uniref:Uncharacterized protein n=1 Tax=Chromera velia CCMP2878 TaxID=1169474 RepID=A0A0G4I149_9ALVE|eukprot:Cvel_30.t1-p1 / transcript=Cvel_30.t1 / gene=Cvel_30 / organism=Chromera_velia_CCMP2878 / gene_product=hypothetical protein / transcript_product=hypothetical protein / location=Cvel_scaffold5:172568-173932(-) / protein_length=69 / sequence_SO=supercontig / SO=protein_coding / is_pseudo=false